MADQILKNRVRCNKCGEVLYSKDPIKNITCECGNVTISGGQSFLIREGSDFEELTEFLFND